MSLAGVSIISLAVEDIPVSTAFYETMGWENSNHSQETIAFLQGHNIVLSLFQIQSVEEEFGESYEPIEFPHVTLAINLPKPEDVDQLFRVVMDAGADPVRKPDQTYWGGYSGYFRDPDGHMWEIAHNPFFGFNQNGQLDLSGGAS